MREMKDSGCNYLGMIPSSWSTSRLKGYFKVSRTTGRPDATVLSLYRDYGIVPKDSRSDNHNVTSLDTSKYKFVEVGDFVVNKMKGWQGSMALSAYEGIVSPAYHVFKFTSPLLLPKYAHYLLRCRSYADEWHKLSTGLRVGQWDLHVEDFLNTRIPIPSLDEQRRIADCLDEECAEIGRAVFAAERSVEEYKAYRLSVISTKMPTGCITIPIKYLCDLLPGYAFESGKFVQGNGVRLLRGINVGVGETRWADAAHYPEEDLDGLEAYALEPGDLVIGLDRPWIKDGLRASFITESDLPCYLVQRVVRVRVPDNLEPRYLKYGLDSGILERYVASGTTGISVHHISHLQIANCKVPLPSLDEQRRIADYLDEKCGEVDAAIVTKQAIIADLKAYKQSLIYETVTGKREV